MTRRAPTEAELRALDFGIRVCKHIKSNAIAFVNEDRTLAVGGGATSRIDPVYAAREKAARLAYHSGRHRAGVGSAVPVPRRPDAGSRGGSDRDRAAGRRDARRRSDRGGGPLGLAMVFTGVRHFRH